MDLKREVDTKQKGHKKGTINKKGVLSIILIVLKRIRRKMTVIIDI